MPLLVPPATAPQAGRPARGIRNVSDLEYHLSTPKYPEYPLKYLDGDGRAVESAAVDRRGRTLAEKRRIRRVEVEHRRRRVERVPACGTCGVRRTRAPLGKSTESHLHRRDDSALLLRGLDRGSFGRVFGGLENDLIKFAAHARTDARMGTP